MIRQGESRPEWPATLSQVCAAVPGFQRWSVAHSQSVCSKCFHAAALKRYSRCRDIGGWNREGGS